MRLFDTLLALRATRGLVAYLAGSALAVAGVIAQGLFRNPLASPDVLGTTAGASFVGQAVAAGVSSQLVRGQPRARFEPELLLAGRAVCSARFVALLMSAARSLAPRPTRCVLLLSGFLLSSLFLALGSFVTSLAQESWELGRAVIAVRPRQRDGRRHASARDHRPHRR